MMTNMATDHCTDTDIEELAEQARLQGVFIPKTFAYGIIMEFLLMVFEAGWNAGYVNAKEER